MSRFAASVILSKTKFNCANILILTCTYELKQRAVNLTPLTVIRRVLRHLNVFYVLCCTMLKSSNYSETVELPLSSLIKRGNQSHHAYDACCVVDCPWLPSTKLHFIPHMRRMQWDVGEEQFVMIIAMSPQSFMILFM